jgi:CheY-like chemotaxis protein
MLESCGYSVLEASDGDAALEINRKEKVYIHLLLTDVVMPGMSGRVLAEQIVAQSPHLVVLYMSGYTGQTVGAHGVLAEGSYFLPKPFTHEALARKIREVLDRRMAPQPTELVSSGSPSPVTEKENKDAQNPSRG